MNGTVLIVDDDVNAQIIAATLLRLRGFDVQIPGILRKPSKCSHLRLSASWVVDINGAGMNGFEGWHRLRVTADTPPIPPRLIVVTDRREPELELLARRLHADAVLRKPMNPGQLIATVEQLVDTPQAALMPVCRE